MKPVIKVWKKSNHITIFSLPVFLLLGFWFFATSPQVALAAEVVGGGIQVQEPDVAQQEMQDLMDLEQEAMGVADVAGDADLTLIVPLEIENLYPNVDRGEIRCYVFRYEGPNHIGNAMAGDFREFDIVDGAYSNTFHFYFVAPADRDFDQGDPLGYKCFTRLKDSESGSDFTRVLTTDTNADMLEGHPQWAVVSGESNIGVQGGVDW